MAREQSHSRPHESLESGRQHRLPEETLHQLLSTRRRGERDSKGEVGESEMIARWSAEIPAVLAASQRCTIPSQFVGEGRDALVRSADGRLAALIAGSLPCAYSDTFKILCLARGAANLRTGIHFMDVSLKF
jgi:hypothetical protein